MHKTMATVSLSLLMLAGGCSSGPTASVRVLAETSATESAALKAPVVDHHAHVWTETILRDTKIPAKLPEVDLPSDLKTLFQERALAMGAANLSDVANIFTEDAQVINFLLISPRWIQGRKNIAEISPGLRARHFVVAVP